ncbi:aromatic ring-hydroxylating oxygenase subunit alpha [Derxia lacustris]|uniref:aromatic ring-hydroxylating oxygenase subunit alpha n=1 Tax=Derxia lacustris TaxID=764842 RepID=UPI001593EDBC|nr:aromatic ring-hydroxylating dioxygenase subunit alpha [Derxia lacustris]
MGNVIDFQPNAASLDALLAEVARIGSQPLEEAQTFPPSAYTHPGLFALEVEKIFKPGWICVAHVSQLRSKGDYQTLNLLGELMVIVNDGERIRVLSRICPHRWAPLVEGCGNARSFACPFHKWTFALDGKCLNAPLMEEARGFDAADYPLPEYRSEVIGGFVYVNLDGKAESLAPQIADMAASMASWQTDKLALAIDLQYECEFNWKIVVETFMECYHHLGAHAASFEPNFPARMSWVEDSRPAWTLGHAAPRPGREEVAFQYGLPHFPGLSGESEQQAFRLYYVYPFHLMHVMPDRVIWFRVQPVAADRTLLQTYVLLHPDTLQMENYDEVIAQQTAIQHAINLEDIGVNAMQQIGAHSGMVKPGRLSHLEKAIWQLNRYVAAKVTA